MLEIKNHYFSQQIRIKLLKLKILVIISRYTNAYELYVTKKLGFAKVSEEQHDCRM